MATVPGTGTPGANQDGALAAPSYSPGEVVTAAGPASINAPAPQIDLSVGSQFVTTAYNLVAYPSLRPQLILDQFATVRATKQTHRGSSVRFSFVDDLAEATTPLLENIDVVLTVEVGNAEIKIRDLLRLNEGSVIELDRLAGDPLDILANGTMIAKGEVVMVGERFGVRFSEIVAPEKRMESL